MVVERRVMTVVVVDVSATMMNRGGVRRRVVKRPWKLIKIRLKMQNRAKRTFIRTSMRLVLQTIAGHEMRLMLAM